MDHHRVATRMKNIDDSNELMVLFFLIIYIMLNHHITKAYLPLTIQVMKHIHQLLSRKNNLKKSQVQHFQNALVWM